jgi:hypothetical protein
LLFQTVVDLWGEEDEAGTFILVPLQNDLDVGKRRKETKIKK